MPHDTDSINSENERNPKSTYEIYRAEADALLRNSEFVKATKSYTKALELRPGDRHCLVNRSKCHLRNDMTEDALRDVNESLAEDANYYKGVLQKAQVLYFQGDFEGALVYFHRGNKLRPELTEFRLGIQKSEEAINNSVGDSNVMLTCDGDLAYFYQHQEKAKKPRGGYGNKYKQTQEKKKVERKKQTMDEKTQKKLLGSLYKDVEFLNHMVKDEKHTAHKTQNSDEINTLAIEALNFLESRTEFWQQQSPARSGKRQDSAKLRPVNMQPARYVLSGLEEIDRKQAVGHHEEAMKHARLMLHHIEGWTDKDLVNRQEVIANLHSIIGNCNLDLGNIGKALTHHKKDHDIGMAYELDDAVSRAQDNIGRCHAKKGDYQAAIDVWERKLPTCQNGLESTWLMHEIGRCYLELGDYSKGKEYGEKSLAVAKNIEDNSWILNAGVLIAQSETKLKDYQAALDSFEQALERAELINNREAEAAIKKAIQEVNNEIVFNEKMKEANENNSFGEENHNKQESPHESRVGSAHSHHSEQSHHSHHSDHSHHSQEKAESEEKEPSEHEEPPAEPAEEPQGQSGDDEEVAEEKATEGEEEEENAEVNPEENAA